MNSTSKNTVRWLILYCLTSLVPAIIGIFFGIIHVYWGDINLIVSDYLGFDLNLILLVYIILLIPFLYGVFLIRHTLRLVKEAGVYHAHIINLILPIIIIILFSAVGLFVLNLLEGYAVLAYQIMDYFFIPFFIGILISMIFIIIIIFKLVPRIKEKVSDKHLSLEMKEKVAVILIIGIYIILFSIPFIHRPANVILFSDVPPKPDIIAHRGGSQMGPENTIEVAMTSIEYDIVGWEVDITISKDGIPFLMHDHTLTRTTNIEDIFPDRIGEEASSFTWSELQQLDAGSWYVEKDPYGLIASGVITEGQITRYKGAKIPSFEEVLEFTKENDLLLDFDAKGPYSGHPYDEKFKEILFDLTLNSGINLNKIMIPTSSSSWLKLIEEHSADEIWTYEDYDNTGDGYTDEEYREAYRNDFPIMTYTINSEYRFEQLWCMGVKWVKTDTPHKFTSINHPRIAILLPHYYLTWIILGSIAISTTIISIITLKKKEN